jgi:hypothetical protein
LGNQRRPCCRWRPSSCAWRRLPTSPPSEFPEEDGGYDARWFSIAIVVCMCCFNCVIKDDSPPFDISFHWSNIIKVILKYSLSIISKLEQPTKSNSLDMQACHITSISFSLAVSHASWVMFSSFIFSRKSQRIFPDGLENEVLHLFQSYYLTLLTKQMEMLGHGLFLSSTISSEQMQKKIIGSYSSPPPPNKCKGKWKRMDLLSRLSTGAAPSLSSPSQWSHLAWSLMDEFQADALDSHRFLVLPWLYRQRGGLDEPSPRLEAHLTLYMYLHPIFRSQPQPKSSKGSSPRTSLQVQIY